MTYENIQKPVMVMWSPWQLYSPTYKYQHWLHSFAFPFWFFFFSFSCLVMICLALWSQSGSSPRISPQRHNYHTGLNVPPTSSGTHQRPFTLQTSSPPILSLGSLSINRMFYSRAQPVLVFLLFFSPSDYPGSEVRWKFSTFRMEWKRLQDE